MYICRVNNKQIEIMKNLKLSSEQLSQLLESNSRMEDFLHSRKNDNRDSQHCQDECNRKLKDNYEMRELLYDCKLGK